MTSRLVDQALAARGWGSRVGFGVAPALVVIDLTNGFTDAASPLGADCETAIAGANGLIAAFRQAGRPIAFSTIVYEEPDARDSGVWRHKIGTLGLLAAGTRWVEQDSRLAVASGDLVLEKKQASCFFGTSFHQWLRDGGIDTLVIAGCSTSGCVRATAVDAAQHGFRTIVAADATGDRLEDAHHQSLVDIDLKYGDVMTVEEIAAQIAQRTGEMAHNPTL